MACNALHKPTAQRELAMVSKFTPVASYLTLSYICSGFYDFVTLTFGLECGKKVMSSLCGLSDIQRINLTTI